MSRVPAIVDRLIEVPVVTSFTNVGYFARSRLERWTELDAYDLTGRVVAITGPTSGLGRAAAEQLARMRATLVLIARDGAKVSALRSDLISATGNHDISHLVADMGDLEGVRAVAELIESRHDRLDVLIHNAGSLLADRRTNADGIEATVAAQVVGPFLMTGLLLDRLRATPGSRVLTMSSGGMYTAGLGVSRLQMDEDSYRGAEQYARAKRAQVTLNQMWAERIGDDVRFHALHPGWADTPGVRDALPMFRRVVGPLLRSPLQGADTLVWLAADDGEPLATNGAFWFDRRTRPIHRLASTAKTDTPRRRLELWEWVVEAAGWGPG